MVQEPSTSNPRLRAATRQECHVRAANISVDLVIWRPDPDALSEAESGATVSAVTAVGVCVSLCDLCVCDIVSQSAACVHLGFLGPA